MKKNRSIEIFCIGLVILSLLVLNLNYAFKFLRDIESTENRALASFPKPGKSENILSYITTFPGNFESYYQDNFPFRNYLIGNYNYFKYKFLGQKNFDKVTIGERGWMYLNYDEALMFNCPEGYDNTQTFKKTTDFLQNLKSELAKRKLPLVIATPPNKESIYPEFYPQKKGTKICDVNLLSKYLNSPQFLESNLKIIDYKKNLLEKKTAYPYLYYQTDTHWNQAGAFFAFLQLIENLGLNPENIATPEFTPKARVAGDLTSFLGFSSYFLEPQESNLISNYNQDFEISIIEPYRGKSGNFTYSSLNQNKVFNAKQFSITNPTRPKNSNHLDKILFISDSFSWSMLPYLTSQFQQLYFLHRENLNSLQSITDEFQPDIVVLQIVERDFFKLTE